MNNSHSESYAAAGVDVTAGYRAVKLMRQSVERTMIPGVVSADCSPRTSPAWRNPSWSPAPTVWVQN